MALQDRLRRLLPALWLGVLLCIAFIATPAPFASLAPADAGRVVARIFVQEAWLSLALAALLFVIERQQARRAAAAGRGSQLSTEMLLLAGVAFCTLAGYFGVQPLLAAARAGQGALSFGQLHALSFGLFGLKMLLLGWLAWRSQTS
ncbi:MAG: DUF4149 domain-containing protein [Burkholderiaceae bacterium]|nr:DUF4149 domain-containing protein [Burkholderiaceae bacterium]